MFVTGFLQLKLPAIKIARNWLKASPDLSLSYTHSLSVSESEELLTQISAAQFTHLAVSSDLSQLAATTTSSHVLLINLPDYFEVLYTPHTLHSGAVQFFTHVKIVVCAWHFCILSIVRYFLLQVQKMFFLNVHSCVSMCYIETTVVGFLVW